MKDLSDFKAPYIPPAISRQEADKFYQTYGKGKIPVDIEDIIEFDLNLQIQPKQNLYALTKADAFLASSCDKIYVDNDDFSNPNKLPYVRFSLAHEIGHFILHKDIIPTIRPSSIEEWKNIVITMPEKEYNFLELHAMEFAGRLLVPLDPLIKELKTHSDNIGKYYETYPDVSDDLVIDYVSVPICKKFEVSDDVISRRIRFEGIWHLVKPRANKSK